MKTFILALCLFAQAASAIVIIEGDISERPVTPPHLLEKFQYQTTLLLDRKTFGSRELTRLDLDELIKRSGSNRLMMYYQLNSTREGVIINLVIDGEARDMLYFFDSLLNHNVISMIYNLGRFPWSMPSDQYKKYWGDIYRGIQREIETEAMIKWGAHQASLSAKDLCSKLLEIQRVNGPVDKKIYFRTPNTGG